MSASVFVCVPLFVCVRAIYDEAAFGEGVVKESIKRAAGSEVCVHVCVCVCVCVCAGVGR